MMMPTRFLCLLLCGCSATFAEHLPIKIYTTADGLARDNINRIVQDSRGYLWICTTEGLSRFDGYTFTNYSVENGLPHRNVTDFVESRDGSRWIGTSGGLCEFIPTGIAHAGQPAQYFIVHPLDENARSKSINVIMEDRAGTLWCGTDFGLYRSEFVTGRREFHAVDLNLPSRPEVLTVNALVSDHEGKLWIGTELGLFRRMPDGQVVHYTVQNGLPSDGIKALLEDPQGRIWFGTPFGGLCRLSPGSNKIQPLVDRVITRKNGLPSNWVGSTFHSSNGNCWVATGGGLSELVPDSAGLRVSKTYTRDNGLSDNIIKSIAEDREGNLWVGTESGGLMKIGRTGFTTYDKRDGLGGGRIASVFGSKSGQLYVVNNNSLINWFDGTRFVSVRPNFPPGFSSPGWGWNQIAFQDHAGEWWIPTAQGLYRFPGVRRFQDLSSTPPRAWYNSKNGAADQVFRLYEDRHGDIWISALDDLSHDLFRWKRESGTFYNYSGREEMPSQPTDFCEDSVGNLWLGFYSGGLARFRDDCFKFFTNADGVPAGMIRDLYLDRSGRLWIATGQGGVGRIDDVQADQPRIKTYTVSEGLNSNEARCITEDRWGRLYIGTGRGVDRLDPATGRINHFTTTDGLANNELNVAYRDRDDALWFGTLQGLSRLEPEPYRSGTPPSVWINGLQVAGVRYPISELGETSLSGLEWNPDENHIQVDFVSIGFGMGDVLRYQYELEGAERGWSVSTAQRSVTYANLSAGSYRFLVRAIDSEGAVSEHPAMVSFRVLPPFWLRWWFVSLWSALIVTALGGIVRYVSVRRLREKVRGLEKEQAVIAERERVRSRIARDLHDDLGATLGSITLYSEAMKQHVGGEPSARELSERISTLSAQAQDALSDVVWSSAPQHDTLADLLARVRRQTAEQCTTKGMQYEVRTDGVPLNLPMSDDVRRNIFLIFKEALNNVIKHSKATHVSVSSSVSEGIFQLILSDDGIGFQAAVSDERPSAEKSLIWKRTGHGLSNMMKRAEEIGIECSIQSSPGHGTSVTVGVKIA